MKIIKTTIIIIIKTILSMESFKESMSEKNSFNLFIYFWSMISEIIYNINSKITPPPLMIKLIYFTKGGISERLNFKKIIILIRIEAANGTYSSNNFFVNLLNCAVKRATYKKIEGPKIRE